MVRSSEPGTPISTEQINGTSVNPSSRAELAGNAAFRSGLTVKITEIKSSGGKCIGLENLSQKLLGGKVDRLCLIGRRLDSAADSSYCGHPEIVPAK